jgi:hypothetical protein
MIASTSFTEKYLAKSSFKTLASAPKNTSPGSSSRIDSTSEAAPSNLSENIEDDQDFEETLKSAIELLTINRSKFRNQEIDIDDAKGTVNGNDCISLLPSSHFKKPKKVNNKFSSWKPAVPARKYSSSVYKMNLKDILSFEDQSFISEKPESSSTVADQISKSKKKPEIYEFQYPGISDSIQEYIPDHSGTCLLEFQDFHKHHEVTGTQNGNSYLSKYKSIKKHEQKQKPISLNKLDNRSINVSRKMEVGVNEFAMEKLQAKIKLERVI